MKIIAECGATKSDWRLISDGVRIKQVLTPGINVSAMSMEVVRAVANDALAQLCVTLNSIPSGPSGSNTEVVQPAGLEVVKEIYLYVAGVVTEGIEEELKAVLSAHCPSASLEIQTDLIAAARAAWIAAYSSALCTTTCWNSRRPVPAGIKLPQITFSFIPSR